MTPRPSRARIPLAAASCLPARAATTPTSPGTRAPADHGRAAATRKREELKPSTPPRPSMQEPTATDARFDRAVLEALHATDTYLRDDATPNAPPTPELVERRIREAAHDAQKWEIVKRAATHWG